MNSLRMLLTAFTIAGSLAAAPLAACAQAPVTQSATASQTATITAIDYTQRVVTLQFSDGTSKTVSVGPEVTRFPQLKVGDKVTFTSTESVVYTIVKPGTAPAAAPDSATMAAAPGEKPGGTATKTVSTVVTVTAIDPSIPSITVKTADGRINSFKVKDPKNIADVKVGDQVQITYNQSLMISVK